MTNQEKIEELKKQKKILMSKYGPYSHSSTIKSLDMAIDLIDIQISILSGNVPEMETDCLFDLDGNLVTAKKVNGKFGLCWVVEDEKLSAKFGKFISIPKQEKTYTKKGLKSGKTFLKPWAYIESNYSGDSIVLYPVQKYYWE